MHINGIADRESISTLKQSYYSVPRKIPFPFARIFKALLLYTAHCVYVHCINNKKVSRNFLVSTCYHMPFTSGTQTAAYTGFAVAIPFYAACIWPTRSCVCPVVYSFSSSMFTSLYTDTSPYSPGLIGGGNHCFV